MEHLDDFIKINIEKQDVYAMAPLNLAYIGDAVYDLYIRNTLVNTTMLNPHKLHVEATTFVKAKSQAELLEKIYDKLNDDEKDIVRRGRNAKNNHLPKNVSIHEYMHATAFEALIGFLYLTKQFTRLSELLE